MTVGHVLWCHTHICNNTRGPVETRSPERTVWRAETSQRTWADRWASAVGYTPSAWSLWPCDRMCCNRHSSPCRARNAPSSPPAQTPRSAGRTRPDSHLYRRRCDSLHAETCRRHADHEDMRVNKWWENWYILSLWQNIYLLIIGWEQVEIIEMTQEKHTCDSKHWKTSNGSSISSKTQETFITTESDIMCL